MPFEILSRIKMYENKFMQVWEKTFRDKRGDKRFWPYIHKRDPVFVFPITNDGQVVLIRSWRVPLEQYVIELPAGGWEPDLELEEMAQRELREEAGYVASSLWPIPSWPYRSGSSDNIAYGFIATGLQYVGVAPEPGEDIEVLKVPISLLEAYLFSSPFLVEPEISHLYVMAKYLGFC